MLADTELLQNGWIRLKVVGVERSKFHVPIEPNLFLSKIFVKTTRRQNGVGKGNVKAVLPFACSVSSSITLGFLMTFETCEARIEEKPTRTSGSKVRTARLSLKIHNRQIQDLFDERRPVTPKIDEGQVISVEEFGGHVLVARGDQDLVASLLHLPDKIFEIVNVCRMIDINNDPHANPETPSKMCSSSTLLG